jgi:hypothetical protein
MAVDWVLLAPLMYIIMFNKHAYRANMLSALEGWHAWHLFERTPACLRCADFVQVLHVSISA